jgi:hypothetical protein
MQLHIFLTLLLGQLLVEIIYLRQGSSKQGLLQDNDDVFWDVSGSKCSISTLW